MSFASQFLRTDLGWINVNSIIRLEKRGGWFAVVYHTGAETTASEKDVLNFIAALNKMQRMKSATILRPEGS